MGEEKSRIGGEKNRIGAEKNDGKEEKNGCFLLKWYCRGSFVGLKILMIRVTDCKALTGADFVFAY